MGEIFGRAAMVIVWLGESDDEDELAFWMVDFAITPRAQQCRCSIAVLQDILLPAFEAEKLERAASLRQICEKLNLEYSSLSLERGLCALTRLWNKPWFECLWVVLEVGLEGQLTLFYSRQKIEDHAMLSAIDLYFDYTLYVDSLGWRTKYAQKIPKHFWARTLLVPGTSGMRRCVTHPNHGLHDLVFGTYRLRTSNHHDRI